MYRILWRSVQGFSVGWGSNFAIPLWLWRSSFQNSHTTAWACDPVRAWSLGHPYMEDQLVTWPMTPRNLERSRSWLLYIWVPLSRKRLEIETRLQLSSHRKWHLGNQMVTWAMTSRDPERSRSWSRYIWMQISWKSVDVRDSAPLTPIGSSIWLIEWSYDPWRHVTFLVRSGRERHQYAGPVILNMAGDIRWVIISCDPKCQVHPDVFV